MRSDSEGPFVIEFIEAHCRITKGMRAGELVKLIFWQKDLITHLFVFTADGVRRYRRAYIQMPHKNGKTYLLSCIALYEAVFGELAGEIYFVAGDRQQASRAFGEIRKIAEADPELRGLFTFYKHSAEIPSTGTVLRVLSTDAGLQLGLEPSFVVFDEVAVQPNDRLWNAMSLGSGTRAAPMLVGISTPGWERDSLAFRLYQHGRKVRADEVEDPTFFFRCFEPSDRKPTTPTRGSGPRPTHPSGRSCTPRTSPPRSPRRRRTSSGGSGSGSGRRRTRSRSAPGSGRPRPPTATSRTGPRS